MSRKARNPKAWAEQVDVPDHRRLVKVSRGHVAAELIDRGQLAEAESLVVGLRPDARRRVLGR